MRRPRPNAKHRWRPRCFRSDKQPAWLLPERLRQERVDESDILEAAREQRGLERLDQVKYAVLECSGKITIIAREQDLVE